MVLTIGQMRSSVAFLSNTPTPLGSGQKDAYSIFLTTRGRLRKKSGGRGLDLGLLAGNDSYELICRFDSAYVSALKNNGKVTVDSLLYTIASWEVVDQIKHFLKFDLNIQVGS